MENKQIWYCPNGHAVYMCSVCESLGKYTPMQWIAQYQRWYCYECKQYTPASNSNVDTSTARIETNRSVLFCSKCGKETLPEATYCCFCGNSLTPTQNNSSKTDQFTLLPSENIMLSLKNANLEQKETFLGSNLRISAHSGRAHAYESKTGVSYGEAWNATHEPPPKLDRILADNLLITDKRMVFIDRGRLIREIIIDKEYAREVLRARGQNNKKAEAEFREIWMKASYLDKMRGKVKHLRDFGFVGGFIFLLKNAERKDSIMRKPEVHLDIFKFVCMGGYAGQAGGPFSKIPNALRSISDGHLTFSDLEQLSDKLLNFLKLKLDVMSDYIESQQYKTDYNS